MQNAKKSTVAHSTKHCVTDIVQCIILGGSLSPAKSKEATDNRKKLFNNKMSMEACALKMEERGMQKAALV